MAPREIVVREGERADAGAVIARLDDARVKLDEFEKRFGAFVGEEERAEVDTLGGLVFYLANRVPSRGELIKHSSGIEFEVVDADPRRVRDRKSTRLNSSHRT